MSARGFTLVELLIATVITLLVVAGALMIAASARSTFLVEPAALDTARRLREGTDALASALRSAGGALAAGDGVEWLGSSVPAVWPLTDLDGGPSSSFAALWVLSAVGEGGRGRILTSAAAPGAALTLDTASGSCPLTAAVCGLDVGDAAVVFDGRGHFDVFEVGVVSASLGLVTPSAPLSRAYAAGSWVVEARADRFGLVRQPDGSRTLTRVTWAGAREPIVDGVTAIDIDVWGQAEVPRLRDAATGTGLTTYGLHPPAADAVDDTGFWPDGEHCMTARSGGLPVTRLADRTADLTGLARLGPADFADGPWCPRDGSAGAFDADLFRIRRIDLRLRVEVRSATFRGPAGRLFARGGTAADPRHWVTDRALSLSVALNR
ncbi:MAG: prepilin-type N-terminal cleavage/methylation domain-containing protein [Acidobacteria bacterium]|nr:prepilin-type N-terminal cleavage/methylation domain-containing protein [Acidobacteriota bacterium]